MTSSCLCRLVVFAALAGSALTSIAASTNVVFINGIQNTLEDAERSKRQIEQVLTQSVNHTGSARRQFSVAMVWNPIGWNSSCATPSPHPYEAQPACERGLTTTDQDQKELFLLKAAEEKFGASLSRISVPYNQRRQIELDDALAVKDYLDLMLPSHGVTPASTSLERDGLVTELEMRPTQNAANALARRVLSLGRAVVVAHSQGNLLAHLAYAAIAAQHGDDTWKLIRVVNVANTSDRSVNGLDFTHEDDRALTLLELLPLARQWSRGAPGCAGYSDCVFSRATPAFGGASFSLLDRDVDHHGMGEVYLSERELPQVKWAQGVTFTPGKTRFVDRFEDFVYTAADSLESAQRPAEDCGGAEPGSNVALPAPLGDGPNNATAMSPAGCIVSFVTNGAGGFGRYAWDRRSGGFVTPTPAYVAGSAFDITDTGDTIFALTFVQPVGWQLFTFGLNSPAVNIVSTNEAGDPQNGKNFDMAFYAQSITPDGRYFVFRSNATNLVPGVGGRNELYRKDLATGSVICVSCTPLARGGGGGSISSNGRILFQALSASTFIETSFLFDPVTGYRVVGSGDNNLGAMSPDGRKAIRLQNASDGYDIYITDLDTLQSTFVVHCGARQVCDTVGMFSSDGKVYGLASVEVSTGNKYTSILVEHDVDTSATTKTPLASPSANLPLVTGGRVVSIGPKGGTVLVKATLAAASDPGGTQQSRSWLMVRR